MATFRKPLILPNNESITLKNGTFREVYLEINYIANTVNTALPAVLAQLQSALVNIEVCQAGNQESYSGVLSAFAGVGYYGTLNQYNAISSGGINVTPPSAGVFANSIIRIPVVLGGLILKGDDYATITCSIPSSSSFFDSTLTTNSTVTFVAEDGVTEQTAIPDVQIYTINPSEPNRAYELGNDVTGVYLLTRALSPTAIDNPFTLATLSSDIVSFQKNAQNMVSDNTRKYDTYLATGNNYCVYRGTPINNATMTLDCNVNKLSANTQYIVITRQKSNNELFAREVLRQTKRMEHKKARVKMGLVEMK